VGRDSVVGIATRYELDGPVRGSKPGGGEIFSIRPDLLWGLPSLVHNEYRVIPRGKAAGTWRWPPTPSSAEVKERVELYLYSPSGPSWPVLGWTLILLVHFPRDIIRHSILKFCFQSLFFSQSDFIVCHQREVGCGKTSNYDLYFWKTSMKMKRIDLPRSINLLNVTCCQFRHSCKCTFNFSF
jgi:hypothetical protein